ncbi:MAG: hypothetical protein ACLRFF_02040 [Alphaproteobacteria bacterium]
MDKKCVSKIGQCAENRRNLHTHTCSFLLSIFLSTCVFPAFSDNNLAEQIQYKEQLIRELKEEIAQIDSETIRCEKAKKGWVAATVVGGVGVAATGTAAIVQTVKAKQKSEEKQSDKGDSK